MQSEPNYKEIDEVVEGMANLTIREEDFAEHQSVDIQKEKLNNFLLSCGVDPVPTSKNSLKDMSERTRRRYVQKGGEVVSAVLEVIAQDEAGTLWNLIRSSGTVGKQLGEDDREEVSVTQGDKRYLVALSEAYHNATTWCARRQILSIISDLASFQQISEFIPDISRYRVTLSRKHCLQYGRGVPIPQVKQTRFRVTTVQLDHFLSFITGPHIIQDLPFGQRSLTLSSGQTLETPNVIRIMIPERIIDQYLQYCQDCEFKPMGRRTLQRILSVCGASTRKSLQGLDYFLAEGTKAFDDLCDITNTLGTYALNRNEASEIITRLKSGKQYLKGDYKVGKH